MVYCVAYNCTNGSGSGKSTFTFPKDQKRRRQWANLVNIKDFVPGKFYNPVLCEDHFQRGCFRNNPEICKQLGRKLFLNEDAVPTIFSKTKTPTKPNYGQDVDSPTVKKQRKSFALTKRHAREVPCGILQAGASSSHAEVEDVESHHETDNAHHSIAVEIQTDPVAQQQGHVLVTSRQCQAELRRPHYSRSIMATPEVKSVLVGGDCVWETKDIGSQTELPLQPVESDPEIPEAESEDEEDDDFYDANDDNDPDYDPAGFLDDYEDDLQEDTILYEEFGGGGRMFMVAEECLLLLLTVCSVCLGSCTVYIQQLKGSGLRLLQECAAGHKSVWDSQGSAPSSRSWLPMGNLQIAAGIFFSGASPAKALNMMQFLKLCSISRSTYNTIQRLYLIPAVTNVWRSMQVQLLEDLPITGAQFAGDARCCSPGHTAKYGSYTLLNTNTGKVVDIPLIQSNEVKNSYAMELEGLKRCLQFMAEKEIQVASLTTDRHSGVKKWLRENHPEIQHFFDVWHMSKGVTKKLIVISKKRECSIVGEWAHSISLHLYWCAGTSANDGELKQAKWLSIMNHVANIHSSFQGIFPQCAHGQLEDRHWMRRGSKAHKELAMVIENKLLVKDVARLSSTGQTSCVESFHKIICFFAPKSTHYFFPSMKAKLFLAALHFNENNAASKGQAKTKSGKAQFSVSHPKGRRGQPVVKPLKEQCTYGYVEFLMADVLQLRTKYNSYKAAEMHVSEMETREKVARTIASGYPKRDKDALVARHITRAVFTP